MKKINSNCTVQRQLNQTASEELSKTAAVWDKREFNCIREDTAYNRVAEFQVIFTKKTPLISGSTPHWKNPLWICQTHINIMETYFQMKKFHDWRICKFMSTQGPLSVITPKNLLIKVLDKDPFGYNHQRRIDIGKHFLLKVTQKAVS